jgi:hypothetical protein
MTYFLHPTPDTVVRWHRQLVRRKWAAFGRRGRLGRPPVSAETRALIDGAVGVHVEVLDDQRRPGGLVDEILLITLFLQVGDGDAAAAAAAPTPSAAARARSRRTSGRRFLPRQGRFPASACSAASCPCECPPSPIDKVPPHRSDDHIIRPGLYGPPPWLSRHDLPLCDLPLCDLSAYPAVSAAGFTTPSPAP